MKEIIFTWIDNKSHEFVEPMLESLSWMAFVFYCYVTACVHDYGDGNILEDQRDRTGITHVVYVESGGSINNQQQDNVIAFCR